VIKKLLRFLLKKEIERIEILAEERGAANAAIDFELSYNGHSDERCGLVAGDKLKLTHKTSYFGKEHSGVFTITIVSTHR
jgi:hypothetical protein